MEKKLANNITVELYNESCFDFLKTLEGNSVDLFLMDPPYEISRKTGLDSCVDGVERFKMSYEFGEWDEKFDGMDSVFNGVYRSLKKGGTAVCFYDLWKITILKNIIEKEGFKQLRFIEWIKTNPVPINSKVNYLTNSREIALTAVKGSNPKFNSKYDNGIYRFPINHEKGRFHPTQKPLPLIEELIKKHSDENDTVVDCFSGSGTTAIASIKNGRNFIGCELNKEFFDKAILRITQFIQENPEYTVKIITERT